MVGQPGKELTPGWGFLWAPPGGQHEPLGRKICPKGGDTEGQEAIKKAAAMSRQETVVVLG